MIGMREMPGGFFVHESGFVDEGAQIGRDTKIWHFCHVNPGAVIGERCSLGQNVVVMPGTRLGANVKVQNNVSIYEGVECGDDVFLGPSMVFTNVAIPRSHVPRKHEFLRTTVNRGASIGANATIICGISLGEYSFVGAGAVVTRDVPPYALVVGVPARVVGWVCLCGERLALPASAVSGREAQCASCGERYAMSADRVHRGSDRSATARANTR
jgi:UDP-2-acetamido-3-amino-2,3-dideoxy-glucuronate N-acetyltransferase